MTYERGVYPLKRHVLKINENPTLRELHNTAFSFSVLETRSLSKSWILENFFVLKYNQTLSYDVKFFLKWHCFNRKFVFYYNGMDIVKKIISHIDRNCYIYMELNEFFIPNRPAYTAFDFYHDILIYGYDENDQIFFTIAYNKDGLYKTQKIHYLNIINAYENYKHKYKLKIMPFRISEKYDFNKFHKSSIKKSLKKMLYSSKKHIGYNAYNDLLKHIDMVTYESGKLDLRAFRTILEHSKTLTYINDYYSITNHSYNLLIELNKKANFIFLLSMKYNLTQSENLILKIKKHILEYMKMQEQTLIKIHSEIFNQNNCK